MSETLTKKMPPPQGKEALPSLIARVRHKLATHLPVAPFNATSDAPSVSFTFDDVPVSAATQGAGLLEDAGVRGTYYVAGGLLGQTTEEWQVIGPDAVVDLHARGHEIGCHSHSHTRADLMSAAAIEADIARNHQCLRAIESSLPLENFAYPYGQTTYAWKRRLNSHFRSSRSIRPRINMGPTDAQFLHAVPLIDREIDEGGIDRAFETAARDKGWLIFYSHDVTGAPSPYGCTPRLMRHALKAAERFGVKIETVNAALTRIGARISTLWLMSIPLI
jgi:peptidoglycan/xylan/chitin deacetylase (PgdA/CDA1 family)